MQRKFRALIGVVAAGGTAALASGTVFAVR